MSSVAGLNAGASRPVSRSSRPSSSRAASARPPSAAGILTPTSDANLNRARIQSRQSLPGPDSDLSGSGKRKRDGPAPAADSLLKAPIVLKPHPSSLTVKPRMLHPLMLLPREHLPLSALDLSQPQGDFPSSRLFESRIKILDLEDRLGSNVLLARSETNRMVFAVEHESNGLYVLCKLGAWVDIETLSQNATVVCRERMRSEKPANPENTSVLPFTTPLLYKESKRRKLAIEEIQLLVRKRSGSVAEDLQSRASVAAEERPPSSGLNGQSDGQSPTPLEEHAEAPTQTPSPVSSGQDAPAPDPAPVSDVVAQPSTEDIFQNIRAQYIEALYHSKGSLAYFAKGPLSRARAAFHLDSDLNFEMSDLIDFLKGLVTTTVLIDKKYRESIPEIVAKMKTLADESEKSAPKPRKRKPKKPKLGKDGLYPGEIEHIRRWWATYQPGPTQEDEKAMSATETKYHISCLRRRETQLQMILILEILALEPLAQPKSTAEGSQLPGTESQVASREASQEPSAKKRNKHNLPVLLDVHADRLCIWQSITLDEVKALAESQAPHEGDDAGKSHGDNSDPLRDFCVDIIIPFFSARLPEVCDGINRKLGGPVAQSPPKVKTAKPAATRPKPGAPAKRATTSKRDRDKTLERALSVERSRRSVSRGPAAAIALMRSASTTVIPGLKREASESVLMGSIPRAESGLLKERPNNLFVRSLSLGGTEDWRAKKKAHVEAELQDAISALKKPNRTLAVKEFVEAAEKRVSAGQLKRLKKPARSSGVQVKATPANNRYKDVLASETQPAPPFVIPPSSASVIPSSTLPRKFSNRLPTNGGGDHVQATPVRIAPIWPGQGSAQGQETPGIPASSPIMARKAAPSVSAAGASQPRSIFLPVPAGGRGGMDLPSSPGLAGLFETPIAPRAARGGGGVGAGVVDDTPIRSRLLFPTAASSVGGGGGGDGGKGKGKEIGRGDDAGFGLAVKKEEVSIYQQLGWDATDLDDIDVMT